jgi:hypothetical protein
METNQVIGYRVNDSNNNCIDTNGCIVYHGDVAPCSIAEAYKRVGLYLELNPREAFPAVHTVTRPLSPMEKASKELGGLLTSLCARHGLDLGLSSEQIERQVAKELAELGATGVGILAAAIRR